MTLPDKEMSKLMARATEAREKEPFYLEHFGADLTTTDSHDVYHLARERARDRITPSQPSREVERQDEEWAQDRPGAMAAVWGMAIVLMAFFGIIIALARLLS